MIKKKSSNRGFGLLFFVVFFLIGIWPLFKENDYRLWSLIISIIFLILGLLNSKLLKPLNNLWIKFGEILGKIIAPIVMMIVFFIVLTPLSFIVRLFGKDLLKLKFIKKNSYWINRKKNLIYFFYKIDIKKYDKLFSQEEIFKLLVDPQGIKK